MEKALKKIRFHYVCPPFYFPHRNKVKAFVFKKLEEENILVAAINYIFCTDEYLLQLNQTYLKHDTLTDIITFELSKKGEPLVADIFISVERVTENAALYKQPFHRELLRVIFHGALHLAGYKDKKRGEAALMRQMEEKLLEEYVVSRGTVSR